MLPIFVPLIRQESKKHPHSDQGRLNQPLENRP